MFRRLQSQTRLFTPAPLLSALVTVAVLFGAVSASADTVLPGSDESIAVARETALELTNPTGPDRLPELKSKAAAAISLRQSRLAELSRRSAKDSRSSRRMDTWPAQRLSSTVDGAASHPSQCCSYAWA